MEAEVENMFLCQETKEVIDQKKGTCDSEGKQNAFCGYHRNKRIPNRRRKRKRPNPQGAANCVRGKCCAERSCEQESIAKVIRNNRNEPKKRKVPDGSADRVGHKSYDCNCGNNEIEFSFACKVEYPEKHWEKTDNSSSIFNMGSFPKKVEELHKKYRYHSWDTSNESAGYGRKRVVDRKLCF